MKKELLRGLYPCGPTLNRFPPLGVMKKELLRGLYLLSWTTASILAADKITLLKYCQEFLASDVSSWSKVVESLKRKRNQFSGAA